MGYETGRKYYFISGAGRGLCLNVYGRETVDDTRRVCLYGKRDLDSLKWIVRREKGYGKIYTALAGGNSFALNLNSEKNPICTMYTAAGNDRDGLLDLLTRDRDKGIYRVKLAFYDLWLCRPDNRALAPVVWKHLDPKDPAFLWKMEGSGGFFLREGERPGDLDLSRPPYTSRGGNPFPRGQCTWYAWGRTKEVTGVSIRFSASRGRNGGVWHDLVTNCRVKKRPDAGDRGVVEWTRKDGKTGHVAFLEDFDGQTVTFTEANFTSDGRLSPDDGTVRKMGISRLPLHVKNSRVTFIIP